MPRFFVVTSSIAEPAFFEWSQSPNLKSASVPAEASFYYRVFPFAIFDRSTYSLMLEVVLRRIIFFYLIMPLLHQEPDTDTDLEMKPTYNRPTSLQLILRNCFLIWVHSLSVLHGWAVTLSSSITLSQFFYTVYCCLHQHICVTYSHFNMIHIYIFHTDIRQSSVHYMIIIFNNYIRVV